MKIYVAGNCQARPLVDVLQATTGYPVERLLPDRDTPLESDHIVFAQPKFLSRRNEKPILYPRIVLSAFHPDIISSKQEDLARSPLRGYSSSIVLKAWLESLSVPATVALFSADTFERLGFYNHIPESKAQLLAEGRAADFPIEDLLERWFSAGCFMHTVNHPKISVMLDIAEILVQKAGLKWSPANVPDKLLAGCGWPVYPGVAERLGLEGKYEFRMHSSDGGRLLELKEFVELSFANCASHSAQRLPLSSRLKSPPYQNLSGSLSSDLRGKHPYEHLPDEQFWRKAMKDEVDPVTSAFAISPDMRIATAGSCFAQHISASLRTNGFNYFVSETDPGSGGENYGVFSARYGNIYTSRQLVQLFRRAYGQFSPRFQSWRRGPRFVDPFRPEIERAGFESLEALLASREVHFEAVRRMFEQLDVFIFTLGLTEAWQAARDGAVFPIAPGVAGGIFSAGLYKYVNFTVEDVVRDLKIFLRLLSGVNPKARVILTVSPVPLIATYESRHVLVSTTYSKSVLRVAADEIARTHANVTYFPSYEIITGSFNRGRYFASDLRTVTPEGVDHVMRKFFRHFAPNAAVAAAVREEMEVVCEEEMLDTGAFTNGHPAISAGKIVSAPRSLRAHLRALFRRRPAQLSSRSLHF